MRLCQKRGQHVVAAVLPWKVLGGAEGAKRRGMKKPARCSSSEGGRGGGGSLPAGIRLGRASNFCVGAQPDPAAKFYHLGSHSRRERTQKGRTRNDTNNCGIIHRRISKQAVAAGCQ